MKKIRKLESQCKSQASESHKRCEEVKLLKEENCSLKSKVQKLEIKLLKNENYHLKTEYHKLQHRSSKPKTR